MTNKSRRRVNLEEVKLSRMKLTLVVNLRLYSQEYVVEMVLNLTCVVCWICLYSKTKWTVPFPG